MKIGIVYDDLYLKHDTGHHVEIPERLKAIVNLLKARKLWEKVEKIQPRFASVEEIRTNHLLDYINMIQKICSTVRGLYYLDGDTPISAQSYDVALLAAGGVITGIDNLMNKKNDIVFCLVRPPGHHAEKERGMGFCLFNNIAIGAKYLKNSYNLKRILIFDWDVHHGNGTQNSFYEDNEVFFVSYHQYPHYPGSGHWSEMGRGKGEGFTLNFPMQAGSSEDDYLYLFNRVVKKILDKFKPEIILISAGFDAHRDDPLSSINLTEKSFWEMLIRMKEWCPEAPIEIVLEGGYNLTALSECIGLLVENALNDLQEEEKIYSPTKYTLNLERVITEAHKYLI